MSLGGGQNTEGTNAGGIYVQFNQDCTSLVAGSSNGYHLFALGGAGDDTAEEIYASRSGQETCLVDRLFSSSLVAVVTLAAPRKKETSNSSNALSKGSYRLAVDLVFPKELQEVPYDEIYFNMTTLRQTKLIVCHYKKGTEICNYSYSNTILAVKLNRSRLVVCLEESLHIHNIRDMKILHTIRETPPNPRGLCALAPSVEQCYLAYPGSSARGEVQIFDAVHLHARCVLSAHDSALAALAFSSCGRRLATASERGTVIRVFAVPDRTRLFEFRRGVKRCVSISCLAFSACATFLAATSNTETVHVFRLQEGGAGGGEESCGEVAGTGEGSGEGGWWRVGRRRGRCGGYGGLDGMAEKCGGRGCRAPPDAGRRRARTGTRLRFRSAPGHRPPRRSRDHQRVAGRAAVGGDVGGRVVRVRVGRDRGRRVRAAATPTTRRPRPSARARTHGLTPTRRGAASRGASRARALPVARRAEVDRTDCQSRSVRASCAVRRRAPLRVVHTTCAIPRTFRRCAPPTPCPPRPRPRLRLRTDAGRHLPPGAR